MPAWLWAPINLCQALFTAAWTAFWVPIGFFLIVVTMSRNLALKWAGTVWAPGLLTMSGAKLEVKGRENVDFTKPHVFVSNHQSTIDIPAVFAALPTRLHFIVKRELMFVPFVGAFVWATGMIFVNRKEGLRALRGMQRVGHLIRSGRSVMAFPEGTRSRSGAVAPFKKGVFVAAIQAQVPIVPLGIQGAAQVMPPSSWRIRPGTITLKIGRPISTEGMTLSDVATLVQAARDAVADLARPN